MDVPPVLWGAAVAAGAAGAEVEPVELAGLGDGFVELPLHAATSAIIEPAPASAMTCRRLARSCRRSFTVVPPRASALADAVHKLMRQRR